MKRSARAQATGSGIVIDGNGTILTNYHVVENAIKVTVSFEKGKTVDAQVVGKDPSNDLAVLRIHPDGLTLHPLTLGNSSGAQVGDPVLRDRQPLRPRTHAHDRRHLCAAAPDHRAERLHDRQRACRPTRRSTRATRAARCSTRSGRVIGINSQIETGGTGGGSVGIGFAVPINTAKSEIAQLEKGGTVRGAYIGLTSLTIDGSLSALNLPVKSGALVQSVQKGTPADEGRHQRRHRQRQHRRRLGGGRRRHHRRRSTARRSTAPKTSPATSRRKKPGQTVREGPAPNGQGG